MSNTTLHTTTLSTPSLTYRADQADTLLNMGAGSRAADSLERLINHALDRFADEMDSMGNPAADVELIERLLGERKH